MTRSKAAGRLRRAGLALVALAIFGGVTTVWLRNREAAGPAILSGVIPWPDRGQAGLSGLVISDDGRMLTVLSDQNYIVTAELARGPDTALQTIYPSEVTSLSAPTQANWPDTWLYTDSEGLARLPDGRLAVAFEALHRVTIFDEGGIPVEWIDVPGLFDRLEANTGIEAVAATANGDIMAIPEAWEAGVSNLPVFSVTPPADDWQITAWVTTTSGFVPVGLDIDRAGRLYLLERRWHWWGGFSNRLRRIHLDAGQITGEEVLFHTPPGRHGNLEGIAIWSEPQGGLMATMVSDNNGWTLMRQEVVEYRLPDGEGN